jgi:hypothetical protein
MKPLHVALSASLAITLAAAQPTSAAEAAKAKAAPAATAADANVVEPAAVSALQRMSAYLGTLKAFEVKSDTSLELVREDGQKIELDGVSHYSVQTPDSFLIEVATDTKVRQFYYDGKTVTVNAPKLGYYSSFPAPPTIRETLDLAHDRYGIVLPLEDLFRWSDPTRARIGKLQSAMVVGTSSIDGVQCDQYAFREGEIDWQIWIQRGDQPVPRKVVIIDRTDEARPAYVARLTWNTSAQFTKATFAFSPPKDAKAIHMAAQ